MSGFLDQASRGQGLDHAVNVDTANRAHLPSRHRLLVGDHRQGFQARLRQPGLLTIENPPFHERAALGPGVVAPSSGHFAQVEAATFLGVLLGQFTHRRLDGLHRSFGGFGKGHDGHGLVGEHQERFYRRSKGRGPQGVVVRGGLDCVRVGVVRINRLRVDRVSGIHVCVLSHRSFLSGPSCVREASCCC